MIKPGLLKKARTMLVANQNGSQQSSPRPLSEAMDVFARALDAHQLSTVVARLEVVLPGEASQGAAGALMYSLAVLAPFDAEWDLMFSGAVEDRMLRMAAFDTAGCPLLRHQADIVLAA